MLASYFAACAELRVSATSAVAAAVAHRKHAMSPLPYHIFAKSQTVAGKAGLVVSLLDYEAQGALRAADLRCAVAMIAPTLTQQDAAAFPQLALQDSHAVPAVECVDILVRAPEHSCDSTAVLSRMCAW